MASRARSTSSACARWPRGRPFTVPIRTRRNRHFLKRTSWRLRWFGGVFRTLRFDNLSSAVKKILRGHQREETTRFIAFRSHWGFQAEFCTPGEGHEKGGVEGEGGQYRRNYLGSRAEGAQPGGTEPASGVWIRSQEQTRLITGRSQTIGAAMRRAPSAIAGKDLASAVSPRTSGCEGVTNFF